MPISGWVTDLITLLADWRTATQNRPRAKVSLSHQYKRLVSSPLPMGLSILGVGLQHPLGGVDQYSRVSKLITEPQVDLRSAIFSPRERLDFGVGYMQPQFNNRSRLVLSDLKEIDLTPVLATEDGIIITTQAGEPIGVF